MWTRMRSDAGLKGVEFGVTLLVMGMLAVLAVPAYVNFRNSATEIAAEAGQRGSEIASVIEEASSRPSAGEIQVAGARLERSTDGATCRWTQSGSSVFGIWELGSERLYGTFDERVEPCPTRAEAVAAGFSLTP